MIPPKFTIDRVSWHTQQPGSLEPREHVIRRFFLLVQFLQAQMLARTALPSSIDEITDDFAITSEDVTELGLELMRKAYDRWAQKAAAAPEPDTRVLERALAKLRG